MRVALGYAGAKPTDRFEFDAVLALAIGNLSWRELKSLLARGSLPEKPRNKRIKEAGQFCYAKRPP
jgi:hypothetical protein